MAEARALKFFLQRETISSLPKGMTNDPLKGRGFAHVTHFCLRIVDVETFLSPLGKLLSTNARTTDFADRTYGA